MNLAERVRLRLKEEKARRHLSERDLSGLLKWSQSKIAQKLAGRTPITLQELEGLCFAVSLAPTEAVRDRGLEFCAELTPLEMRFLEVLRDLTPEQTHALMQLLRIAVNDLEPRGATTRKNKLRRGGRHANG